MKCVNCEAEVSILKRDIATGFCPPCFEIDRRECEEKDRQQKLEREANEVHRRKERKRRIDDFIARNVTECAKCGESKIIKSLKVVDETDSGFPALRIAIEESPTAVLLTGRVMPPLNASACGNCGYTELYVQSPATLWRSFTKSAESSQS